MTFLFNSDAKRGAIFAEAFARELPDIAFSMDPKSVEADAVRYLITWTVPDDLARYRNLEILFRSAPVSTSSVSMPCRHR